MATPVGPARVHLLAAKTAQSVPGRRHSGDGGLVVLGHGAGGGVEAADLRAAGAGARAAGWSVALVEQPWRVAGRRVAPPPARLDEAWCAVVAAVRLPGRPLVVGGRSAGARSACRTASSLGADGVLAIAFPLRTPSGRSRLEELLAPLVPRLVIQGARDAFGVPEPADGVQVHVVTAADHFFAVRRVDRRQREDVLAEIASVTSCWLARQA